MEETRWKEKNQYLGLTEDGRRVRLLDQSQLPNREVWLELEEPEELAEASCRSGGRRFQTRG